MFILIVSVSVSPKSFNSRDADYLLRIFLTCTWPLSKIHSLNDRIRTVILGSFNTGAYFYNIKDAQHKGFQSFHYCVKY